MKTVAIIPSAGKGKRMKKEVSKPYLLLADKPILAHTLSPFEESPLVHEVIVTVSPGEIEYCRREVIEAFNLTKVNWVLAGGKERQDSIWEGLKKVPSDCGIIIIHDGARPLVTRRLIESSIEAAQRYGAVVTAIPLKDTVKLVSREREVIETPVRHTLMTIQTPQAFRFDVIRKAYEKAYRDGFYGTDDSSLVERIGIKVRVIPGTYENLKITTPEDLILAEALLERRKNEG
ncbi:MAG: 2-C-methyl-D-erythritol 4-phosphate cytidylyltransferase [Proteobacteria bacterium]|nr:2-C-methyl-D-erythritol 4-phosphate cytidylyltransferase [Pseudomonadota bacterium]